MKKLNISLSDLFESSAKELDSYIVNHDIENMDNDTRQLLVHLYSFLMIGKKESFDLEVYERIFNDICENVEGCVNDILPADKHVECNKDCSNCWRKKMISDYYESMS